METFTRSLRIDMVWRNPVLQKILRLRELTAVTGLKRSAIYAQIAEGTFPKPIPLGERAVGWLESDIENWQQERIAARCAGHAAQARS